MVDVQGQVIKVDRLNYERRVRDANSIINLNALRYNLVSILTVYTN